MDRGASEPAEILDRSITLDSDARRASSIDVGDDILTAVDAVFDAERKAVAAFFDVRLIGREGAGFIRYPPGGFYRAHRDAGDLPSWPAAARRRISVVLFLNTCREVPRPGEFGGGILKVFENEPMDVVPRQGLLVAFPSTDLHEVTPVWSGARDVIVDWYY